MYNIFLTFLKFFFKWAWFEKFSFFTKILEKICCHGNHDNMCKTFCEHSWYFCLILTLKIIIKKKGNWFENFLGKYVAMATMICIRHFMNIPDIFFNSCFKNNNKKKRIYLKNFHFSQKSRGKICCHGNHDKMCLQSFEI